MSKKNSAFVALLAGVTLNFASEGTFGACEAPAGTMVVSGGKHVHVLQTGLGKATVVFVSGLGEDLSTWRDVQPAISSVAVTISYDRAGLGCSDPAPAGTPRDARQLAAELHGLLDSMEVRRPVIFVGHSLGGAIVEVYAKDYGGEVAGLVLVDPEDGRLIALERSAMPGELWAVHERRVMDSIGALSVSQRLELEALEASGELVRRSLPLPGVPSVLLTGTKKNPEFPGNPIEQDLKLQLHVELARTTPRMQHWLVPTSRHYIQNDVPDEVIQAIKRVLALARKDGIQ